VFARGPLTATADSGGFGDPPARGGVEDKPPIAANRGAQKSL